MRGARAERRGERVDLPDRAAAQEAQRQVQRLGIQQAQRLARAAGLPRRGGHAACPLASCSRTASGGSTATNSLAVAPRDIARAMLRLGVRSSARRTRCIATVVARSRTSARPPGRLTERVSALAAVAARRSATPGPTGFSSLPPPGPATPVTPTPTSAPRRARAPSASARATSAETAPCALDQLSRHARLGDLHLVRVRDDPAVEVLRGAGRLGQPRRQQAARARLGGGDRARGVRVALRRAAAPPPARRRCCRRARTACRRGASRRPRRTRRRRPARRARSGSRPRPRPVSGRS